DASVVDDGRNSRRLIEYSTGKGDIGPMVGNGSTSTPLRNVGNHHANDTVDSTAVDVEGICEDEEASPEEEEDDHHQDVFMTPPSTTTGGDAVETSMPRRRSTTSQTTTRRSGRRPSVIDNTTPLDTLRVTLGSNVRHTFGKFVKTTPMVGSLVVTVDDSYTGLARVVDDDGNGNVKVQPMNVEKEGPLIKTVDNNDKDCFNTAIENVIYVRPSSRSLTSARGRELVELLDYVNGHLPPN
ncbi:hypothetical protein FOZ62_027463, partial [Perkinsus olseni]